MRANSVVNTIESRPLCGPVGISNGNEQARMHGMRVIASFEVGIHTWEGSRHLLLFKDWHCHGVQ